MKNMELVEQLLLEKSRQELINKSQSADTTKTYGTTRWDRRGAVKPFATVENYNRLDFNAIFKGNLLNFVVPVHGDRSLGSTDDYSVEVLFEGVCDKLKQELQRNNYRLEYKIVYRAIVNAINSGDVLVSCTCPDWCLDGSTELKLLNGEVYTVEKLKELFDKGTELWVYSTDENGDFKPGHISDVWITGYTNELVKVTLDNGKEIITTPNHKYMLRTGDYMEASQLMPGQSLMPLYFRDTDGYETVKLNSKKQTAYFSVYKLVAEEELKQEIEEAKIRSGEDVIAIHHSDFNKSNNYPSNLVPMGRLEHYTYHYEHVLESPAFEKWIAAGEQYREKVKDHSTPEYEKQAEVMRSTLWSSDGFYANATSEELSAVAAKRYTDEWRSKIGNSNKSVWENYSEDEYKARCEINKIANSKWDHSAKQTEIWASRSDSEKQEISNNISSGISNAWKEHPEVFLTEKGIAARKNNASKSWGHTPEAREAAKQTKIAKYGSAGYCNSEKAKQSRCKRNLYELIDKGLALTEDNFNKNRKNGDPRVEKVFSSFDDMLKFFDLTEYNHKVVNVEKVILDTPVPVYDLTVDKWNNFYVNAGIILHNCYRQAYQGTMGRYNAGRPELRPANITNPNDTKGAGCKHVLNVLGNLDWAMNLATSITNYCFYIKDHYPDLFAQVIWPAISGIEYKEAEDDGYFDDLASTVGTINSEGQYDEVDTTEVDDAINYYSLSDTGEEIDSEGETNGTEL